jgi:hypothetical protein
VVVTIGIFDSTLYGLEMLAFIVIGTRLELNFYPLGRILKKFGTTKLALQKILKGFLHTEEETRVRQKDSEKINPFEQTDK